MYTFYLALPFRPIFYIESDCDKLISKLVLQYGIYAKEHIDISADISFSILRKEQGYIFSYPNGNHYTETPLLDIGRYISQKTTLKDEILALHGASLEYNGQAYIFLAPTTTGKTTLTSYLSSLGFGYITDDCVIIDRNDFKVYPYNTPIHLRDGGTEVLKKLGILPSSIKTVEEGAFSRRHVYTPLNIVSEAIPLKRIYFIERNDSENKLTSMTTTERATELMKSPITPYEITADYIKLIMRLSKIDCQRLIYKDMSFVKEMIELE